MALKVVGDYWHADVKVGTKRVRVSTGFRLDQEAQAKAKEQEIRRKLRNGTWEKSVTRTKLTLRAALDRALAEHYHNSTACSIHQGNANTICEYIDGDMLLEDVDEEVLVAFVDDLLEDGRTGSTCNRLLSMIGRTMKLAIGKWRVLSRLPFFPRQAEGDGRIRIYSVEEEERIVDTLRGMKHRRSADVAELVMLLVDTGCRLSEGLRVTAPDFNRRTGLLTMWKTKNKRPRSVPVLERSVGILERRFALGPEAFEGLTKDRVEDCWKALRRELHEGDDFVIHALRHTAATRLLEAGVDIYTVQKWLGHTTTKTTERYVHLTGTMLAGAKEKIEAHRAALHQLQQRRQA